MTREEIIRMAKDAGPLISTPFDAWCERFAALAVWVEREACAKVCEEHWRNNGNAMECADAIRARGKK